MLLLITGCAAVGPDYRRPGIKTAAQWQPHSDPALLPGEKMIRQWWTLFNDPILDSLISTAAENNLDLLAAVARVEETRFRYGMTRAQGQPRVDAQADITRTRSSANSLSTEYTQTVHSPFVSASWELDLFGRVRRSLEAAAARVQASQEDQMDVLISVYAHVSLTYLEVRTLQARLEAVGGNIESCRELLDLTRSRFKHGIATALDVAQAERLLAGTEALVPPLRIGLAQAMNDLGVLLGLTPGTLNETLTVPGPIPLPPSRATVGIPADLMRRRPDIRRAERILAAQTAQIGVAKADLYPRLSLSGSFGFESVDAADLFDAGSRIFAFGPSLRWHIFSGREIQNRIKVEDALARQSMIAYEQTVLNALKEVEDHLKAYIEDRVRLSALERSVRAAGRSVTLAADLYKKGLVDFQPVLDAQRDLFDFENRLATARGDSAGHFVRLYAALGGGWDPEKINSDLK